MDATVSCAEVVVATADIHRPSVRAVTCQGDIAVIGGQGVVTESNSCSGGTVTCHGDVTIGRQVAVFHNNITSLQVQNTSSHIHS
ncbi:hypothetical protein C4A43_03917 [Escherichia coli]|nr:hypothetical protein C4A43_03917 [Escherichia coli]